MREREGKRECINNNSFIITSEIEMPIFKIARNIRGMSHLLQLIGENLFPASEKKLLIFVDSHHDLFL